MRFRLLAVGLLAGALAAGADAAPQQIGQAAAGSQVQGPAAREPDELSDPQVSPVAQNGNSTFGHVGSRPSHSTTLRSLPSSLLRDQKAIWLSPFRIGRDQWSWLAPGTAVTVVLFATDRRVAQHLAFSPPGTGYAIGNDVGKWGGVPTDLLVAGSFLAIGQWNGNERARDTGVLGVRAVLNSIVVAESLKTLAQRPRPSYPSGQPNHASDGEFFTGGRSFPSGHSAEAWALAAVVARQYRHRRWVPPLVYALATVVAVSRVPARKHFPSDVFVGGAVGYLIGRQVWQTAASGMHPLADRRWQIAPQATPGGGASLALHIVLPQR
jgi:membrane-associated phospholipid phosphatase